MDNKELHKAIAETAKTAGQSASKRSAYAELMIELIEPNHLTLELFRTFMPARQANLGDVPVKRVRRGRYPVQSMVPNTAHLVANPPDVQDYHTFIFDRLITGVRESTWNLENNPITTTENIRNGMRADLSDAIIAKIFSLLSTTWNSTDTPSNYSTTANLTYAQLDTMIENVMYTAGDVKAIIGTRRAVRDIYEFAGFREYAYAAGGVNNIAYPVNPFLLEYLNTNRVSVYKGVPIIELPQVFRNRLPNLREALIPEDKILVIGADAGEILMYGDITYQDYTDMTVQPADYVLHGWMQYGLVVDMPENIGVIKLT